MRSSSRRLARRRQRRGFTLVELMAVVAITGILAAIGVVLVRQHLQAAKTNDALASIQAIRAAQESFRAQGGTYLNCSRTAGPLWYPMTNPSTTVFDWRQPAHLDWPQWQILALPRTRGSLFGFLVNAGLPGADYPTFMTAVAPVLPSPPQEPWYVIQVRGDRDGDGTPTLGVATSLNNEVYLESDSE